MRPWMVVGLGLVLAAPIVSPAIGQADAGLAGRGAHWRDAGVVMNAVPKAFMADASTSGVFVAVGSSGAATTLARRAGGHWQRVRLHIGSPAGVDVNDTGDAVALSVRSDGAVLATAWRHGTAHPHTSVVVSAAASPSTPTAELVANGRGDLAAVVRGKSGHASVVLVRKPLRKPWGRPMSISPSRYGAALDSIDVGNGGVVVGAFRKGPKLTMRVLRTDASHFGPAQPVTTWREPGRHPAATQVHADIQIGRGGDVATLWSYRLGTGRTALLDVLPSGGHRFQTRIGRAGANDLAAVGDDGSVLLSGGLRWNPNTRRLVRGSSLSVVDADSRGDAFMGAATHTGAVAVWPMGRPQDPRVAPPSGRQVDAVLTTDLLAYLVVVDSARQRLTLSTRAF